MMSISPVSGQRPSPSAQNAGQSPAPAASFIRAAATPYVKVNFDRVSIRPEMKSNARPSGVVKPLRYRGRITRAPSATDSTSAESTYACCSSLTVRPVTTTFHLERSSSGPEKSSKNTVRSGWGPGAATRG
jgi:hypothetical protein